ncbi:MAG: 23S rRNA (adenine(2503)-C(2))-methyltransferase RlmN [Oscillospiraceae bacterium]|nr:23S rRNA (adenine(2503)-C(2))-methyltransferase RlmN [Oscillospiraceae bacterium]MBR6095866.1 23S rRNA (adenine(2503)-C(2))-methyltransferase RlmN [Oscillospiraceae bacterium]
MRDLRSLLPGELEALLEALGEPKYRARQLFTWLNRGAADFDSLKNLPRALREKLAETSTISALRCLRKSVSQADGTVKYLWELPDGNAVETVVMRYAHGATVCISSQVGCRMGCAFCASAIGGLVRNLTAGEMLAEVLFSQLDYGEKLSNIVLMGIGEPLDNYDEVLRFLRLVNCPEGLNIGMRHISLSTCGLTERIADLAREDLQLTLAISLHAPDDETRSRLMPANRGRGVAEIVKSCQDYFAATGRRITFEYAMIDGVNDSPGQARALADLARQVKAHVNLIPLNHVEERRFAPSRPERMRAFSTVLDRAGVNYTVRRSLGGDVDASCGQLRRKRERTRQEKEGAAEA